MCDLARTTRALILRVWPVCLAAVLLSAAYLSTPIGDPLLQAAFTGFAVGGAAGGLIVTVFPRLILPRVAAAAFACGALLGRGMWVSTSSRLPDGQRATAAAAYVALAVASVGMGLAATYIVSRGDRVGGD